MEYQPNRPLPDLRIKPPFERIVELCKIVAVEHDKKAIKNMITLISLEIKKYDKLLCDKLCDGEELPF